MARAARRRIDSLWTVVLAAGASRRLGRSKQLLKLAQRSLLVRAIGAASVHTRDRIVVVIGADSWRIRTHLRHQGLAHAAVHNGRWSDGMGQSLSTGIRALPSTAAAALILLADQPRVDRRAIGRLVTAWLRHPARIAAALYDGRHGVPAIFPRRRWPRLRAAGGDQGARALLRADSHIQSVPMSEASIDIDTPEDAAQLGPAGRFHRGRRR